MLLLIIEIAICLLTSFMLGWTAYNLPLLIIGVIELYKRRIVKEDKKFLNHIDLPFFSLILPMKNEEKVAERILAALINVDYPRTKYEILIVDDLSTDRTQDICMQYENRFPGRAFRNSRPCLEE